MANITRTPNHPSKPSMKKQLTVENESFGALAFGRLLLNALPNTKIASESRPFQLPTVHFSGAMLVVGSRESILFIVKKQNMFW